jgi:hypothetical protein
MVASACEKCAGAGAAPAPAKVLVSPCAGELVCGRRGCDAPFALAPLRLCAVDCPHLTWEVLSETTNSAGTKARGMQATELARLCTLF